MLDQWERPAKTEQNEGDNQPAAQKDSRRNLKRERKELTLIPPPPDNPHRHSLTRFLKVRHAEVVQEVHVETGVRARLVVERRQVDGARLAAAAAAAAGDKRASVRRRRQQEGAAQQVEGLRR